MGKPTKSAMDQIIIAPTVYAATYTQSMILSELLSNTFTDYVESFTKIALKKSTLWMCPELSQFAELGMSTEQLEYLASQSQQLPLLPFSLY